MSVENCKRCKRVFRKTHSPFCPECYQQEMQGFDKVYQYLGKAGQGYIHLSEIAENCGIPIKDVEDLFFSGKLGLAGNRVSFNCQICEAPINRFSADRKRLCPVCANTVEVEGKLNVDNELIDDKPKKAPVKEAPPRVPEPSRRASEAAGTQYGFKRLSDR